MSKLRVTITLLLAFLLADCSKDTTDLNQCRATNASMKVNDELVTLVPNGKSAGSGIPLTVWAQNPYMEQSFSITVPYKVTGNNRILGFNYHQYINGQSFDGQYVNGEIQGKVITNKNTCVYIEFSGKISNGSQELLITEGKYSYTYEDPFDF